MIVYIAEKPDIATAMAAYLWSDYSSYKHKHCYQKGGCYCDVGLRAYHDDSHA